MYQPSAFREEDPARLAGLIRAYPLALLITQGQDGPQANPLPLLFDAPRQGDTGRGVLRGHLAKANPQARQIADSGTLPALAVFQGPAAYVSPGWYASKQEHGKVVPTWNYVMVQARGPARAVSDKAWLRRLVEDLTTSQEAARADPWAVDDAPEDFVETMLRGIVGIEIAVEQIAGKWKLSQNRDRADRNGVIAGLDAQGDTNARALASMMRAEAGD